MRRINVLASLYLFSFVLAAGFILGYTCAGGVGYTSKRHLQGADGVLSSIR